MTSILAEFYAGCSRWKARIPDGILRSTSGIRLLIVAPDSSVPFLLMMKAQVGVSPTDEPIHKQVDTIFGVAKVCAGCSKDFRKLLVSCLEYLTTSSSKGVIATAFVGRATGAVPTTHSVRRQVIP